MEYHLLNAYHDTSLAGFSTFDDSLQMNMSYAAMAELLLVHDQQSNPFMQFNNSDAVLSYSPPAYDSNINGYCDAIDAAATYIDHSHPMVNDSLVPYYDAAVDNLITFSPTANIIGNLHVNSDDQGASCDDIDIPADEGSLNDAIVKEDDCNAYKSSHDKSYNCEAITGAVSSDHDVKSSFPLIKSQIRKCKKTCSEQKRRKNLNEKLYSLRALVPSISKMDKASIIQDAITYVKDLQNQVDDLKAELDGLHQCHHHILEFNVAHIEGERYNLELYCKKSSNVLVQLIHALESLELFEIVNGNLIAMHDRILNVITIEVKNGRFMKIQEIQQIVLNKIVKFGFFIGHVERATSPTMRK